MTRLAAQPDRLMRAQADLFSRYMDLWQSAARRMTGEEAEPVVSPAKGDKRFNDPDWASNPMFDVMKQSYLLSSNWLNELVAEARASIRCAKRRVEFFTKMLTDAFSPSNFLISNPAALREVMSDQGREPGARHGELRRRPGARRRPAGDQPDGPRQVHHRRERRHRPGQGRLPERHPATAAVRADHRDGHEIPLVIFPPWINKFYILDLRPENSMIRWLTGQGFTVFVASWVNPTRAATATFEDYMFEGIYDATQQVMTQCGVDQVNTVGYCIGGTLLSCALAHMAAKGDKRINLGHLLRRPAGLLRGRRPAAVHQRGMAQSIERQMDEAGGLLPSQSMADTFNALRGNDLIWSFFVNNYLMGKEPGRSTCCSGTPTRRGCPRPCTCSICAISTRTTP
jgi:polyhydroxyalkanoate synthase